MVRAHIAHHAGTGPPGPGQTDVAVGHRPLTERLAPACRPAGAWLQYRLLPLNSELKEGNAVPIYLRLVHEQNDATRKYWTETPKPWNGMPVDKIP